METVQPPNKQLRFSLSRRGTLYCVYDDHTGGKIESFFTYKKALRFCQKINEEWSLWLEKGGGYDTWEQQGK